MQRAFHLLVTAAFITLTLFIYPVPPAAHTQEIASSDDSPGYQLNPARLPLHFEANRGQSTSGADYLSRGDGYALHLTSTEATFMLRQRVAHATEHGTIAPEGVHVPETRHMPLAMQVVNGNPQAVATADSPLGGASNYFIGNDPAKWVTDVAHYGEILYQEVYPGTDLRYYGNQGALQYDFILSPGANPANIVLQFEGAEDIEIAANGDLLLQLDGGLVRQAAPFTYQTINSRQVGVESRFILLRGNRVAFEVADYDAAHELVIDPTLVYSTYLGGSDKDEGDAIVVDSTGAAYVTGDTFSADFPTLNPYQTAQGSWDVFVTKINPAGDAIVFSTYLGGSTATTPFEADDFVHGIDLDSSNNVYLAGQTSSTDFPTASPIQGSWSGDADGFLTKLSSTGNSLVYSTYLGGTSSDIILSLAVHTDGTVAFGGVTLFGSFPLVNPLFSYSFAGDGFVGKVNAAGSAVDWATALGGSAILDAVYGVDLMSDGDVVATGETGSSGFPVSGTPLQSYQGGQDAFIVRLAADGSSLDWGTFLGGTGNDVGYDIAVNDTGIYVGGFTDSTDFLTVNEVYSDQGGRDFFVTKINGPGSAWQYSTYLGGSGDEEHNSMVGDNDSFDIAIDSAGAVYLSAETESTDYPLVNEISPVQGQAVVTKINAEGTALEFSTRFGGTDGDDVPAAVAVDSGGENIWVTGAAYSTDFPTVNPLYTDQPERDAFVMKINLGAAPAEPLLNANPEPPGPLAMAGLPGSSPTTTFTISNAGDAGSLLDVSLDSLTGGYSVVSGLPVTGLGTSDGAVTVTVQCDNPGTTAAAGTLQLATNAPGQATVTYDLTCDETSDDVNPPTILDVQTACDGLTVRYLARGGPAAAFGYAFRVYREMPGGADVLLLTETVPALAAGEVYEVALSLGRMFPAGTALYVSVATDGGEVVTPAAGCTVP